MSHLRLKHCICQRSHPVLPYSQGSLMIGPQKLAKIMIVFSVATFLASMFWHIFSCYPIRRAWQVKLYLGGKNYFSLSV